MLRADKKEFVITLEEVYKCSSSIIVTHYHGLKVSELTALRKALRQDSASFQIVKNTLNKIAANKAGMSEFGDMFSGPTAIAYSSDPIAAAKNIVEFAKTNDKLVIIGGVVNNKVIDAEGVSQLAKLPSLTELRGGLIGLLQTPAINVIRVVQAPALQIVRVLQAYGNKE